MIYLCLKVMLENYALSEIFDPTVPFAGGKLPGRRRRLFEHVASFIFVFNKQYLALNGSGFENET